MDTRFSSLPDETRLAVEDAAAALERARAALSTSVSTSHRARREARDAKARADLMRRNMAEVKPPRAAAGR